MGCEWYPEKRAGTIAVLMAMIYVLILTTPAERERERERVALRGGGSVHRRVVPE